jgi:hypothetical protein
MHVGDAHVVNLHKIGEAGSRQGDRGARWGEGRGGSVWCVGRSGKKKESGSEKEMGLAPEQ